MRAKNIDEIDGRSYFHATIHLLRPVSYGKLLGQLTESKDSKKELSKLTFRYILKRTVLIRRKQRREM